jgi:hypothetical protein
MNTTPNDGGPAFPNPCNARTITGPSGEVAAVIYEHAQTHGGMSLRDWFAGQALAAKTAPGLIGYEDHAPNHRALLIGRLVRDAWEIADAMLAARNKKP